MILDQDTQWTNCECDRCGVKYTISTRRLTRSDYCVSCVAKPAKRINYKTLGYCTPWHGEFDESENPIQHGKLFKAGVRTCGHRDCVRDSHIQRIVEPKPKRLTKISLQQLQAVVDAHVKHYGSLPVCGINLCDSKSLSKGLCSKHYASWTRQTKKKVTA
jgi:hypothetical protein